MKLLLEICVLGKKGCLRQSIKYIMLLFVRVKITLFYDKGVGFFCLVFVCLYFCGFLVCFGFVLLGFFSCL